MARRTVAEELRRVLARLGGTPAAREVPPPSVAVHAPGLCVALTTPLTLGIAADAGTVPAPSATGRRLDPEIAVAEGRGLATILRARGRATGVRVEPPEVRHGALSAVLRAHDGGPAVLTAAVSAVGLCEARALAGPPPLAECVPGRVAPLPPIVAVGTRPDPAGPLFLARRERVDWGLIGRERLARGWARVLRDHALPADDLRLIGVFGPLPLAAVAGVVLGADGRLGVRLVRPRLPGPAGDVVLARHEPSGTLLRSDVA